MNTYTYSQARQQLASLLDKAQADGKVLIKRKDGSMFELRPFIDNKSPLDVKGIDINIKKSEILDVIREVRER